MALRSNSFLSNEGLAAILALLAFGQAGLGAGRFNCRQSFNILMLALGSDLLAALKDQAADGALLAGSHGLSGLDVDELMLAALQAGLVAIELLNDLDHAADSALVIDEGAVSAYQIIAISMLERNRLVLLGFLAAGAEVDANAVLLGLAVGLSKHAYELIVGMGVRVNGRTVVIYSFDNLIANRADILFSCDGAAVGRVTIDNRFAMLAGSLIAADNIRGGEHFFTDGAEDDVALVQDAVSGQSLDVQIMLGLRDFGGLSAADLADSLALTNLCAGRLFLNLKHLVVMSSCGLRTGEVLKHAISSAADLAVGANLFRLGAGGRTDALSPLVLTGRRDGLLNGHIGMDGAGVLDLAVLTAGGSLDHFALVPDMLGSDCAVILDAAGLALVLANARLIAGGLAQGAQQLGFRMVGGIRIRTHSSNNQFAAALADIALLFDILAVRFNRGFLDVVDVMLQRLLAAGDILNIKLALADLADLSDALVVQAVCRQELLLGIMVQRAKNLSRDLLGAAAAVEAAGAFLGAGGQDGILVIGHPVVAQFLLAAGHFNCLRGFGIRFAADLAEGADHLGRGAVRGTDDLLKLMLANHRDGLVLVLFGMDGAGEGDLAFLAAVGFLGHNAFVPDMLCGDCRIVVLLAGIAMILANASLIAGRRTQLRHQHRLLMVVRIQHGSDRRIGGREVEHLAAVRALIAGNCGVHTGSGGAVLLHILVFQRRFAALDYLNIKLILADLADLSDALGVVAVRGQELLLGVVLGKANLGRIGRGFAAAALEVAFAQLGAGGHLGILVSGHPVVVQSRLAVRSGLGFGAILNLTADLAEGANQLGVQAVRRPDAFLKLVLANHRDGLVLVRIGMDGAGEGDLAFLAAVGFLGHNTLVPDMIRIDGAVAFVIAALSLADVLANASLLAGRRTQGGHQLQLRMVVGVVVAAFVGFQNLAADIALHAEFRIADAGRRLVKLHGLMAQLLLAALDFLNIKLTLADLADLSDALGVVAVRGQELLSLEIMLRLNLLGSRLLGAAAAVEAAFAFLEAGGQDGILVIGHPVVAQSSLAALNRRRRGAGLLTLADLAEGTGQFASGAGRGTDGVLVLMLAGGGDGLGLGLLADRAGELDLTSFAAGGFLRHSTLVPDMIRRDGAVVLGLAGFAEVLADAGLLAGGLAQGSHQLRSLMVVRILGADFGALRSVRNEQIADGALLTADRLLHAVAGLGVTFPLMAEALLAVNIEGLKHGLAHGAVHLGARTLIAILRHVSGIRDMIQGRNGGVLEFKAAHGALVITDAFLQAGRLGGGLHQHRIVIQLRSAARNRLHGSHVNRSAKQADIRRALRHLTGGANHARLAAVDVALNRSVLGRFADLADLLDNTLHAIYAIRFLERAHGFPYMSVNCAIVFRSQGSRNHREQQTQHDCICQYSFGHLSHTPFQKFLLPDPHLSS